MSHKVSIVIPMYNSEKYIYQCLYSCINQTHTDIEIVVVDDFSSDGSIEIVQGICDKRIQILRSSGNQGTAAARNTGIAKSTGEFIALLDSDDMLTHDSIAVRLKAFEQVREAQIVGGYAYVISDDRSSK